MRHLAGPIGLAQLAGVALVIRYVTEPDDYYLSGRSYWEHASNGGRAGYAAIAIVIAAVIAFAFLAQGIFFRRLKLKRLAIPAVVLYFVLLYGALFLLFLGP